MAGVRVDAVTFVEDVDAVDVGPQAWAPVVVDAVVQHRQPDGFSPLRATGFPQRREAGRVVVVDLVVLVEAAPGTHSP